MSVTTNAIRSRVALKNRENVVNRLSIKGGHLRSRELCKVFRNRYKSRIEICEVDKEECGSKQLFLPILSIEMSQSSLFCEEKKNPHFLYGQFYRHIFH